MPAGQGVALQPAMTVVLGEHLHDPPVPRESDVLLGDPLGERPVGHLEDGTQPVAVGLVGAEQAEGVGVAPVDVAHQLAEPARRLGAQVRRPRDVQRIVAEVRQVQVDGEQAPVGVRRPAHPQCALRVGPPHQVGGPAVVVEQLLRPVGPQPRLEDASGARRCP